MSNVIKPVVYHFVLRDAADPKVLERLLTLALKESELIYGKAQLKLETNYGLDLASGSCDVEGGTECGEHLAKLLSGFLIRQVGEDGFRVERISSGGAQ